MGLGARWWAAGLDHQEVGQRRDCFPCADICAGTGPLRNPSTKPGRCPLTFPFPARLSFLLPLLPSPKPEEVGLVPLCAAPSPTALCEPGTPWVALGTELEVLTKGQLRPVTCAAVGGPRSEGPRDHVGRSEGVAEWTSSPALTRTRNCPALSLPLDAQMLSSHAVAPPTGPPDGGGQHLPHVICPHVACRVYQPCRLTSLTVFSPELGCFIYCLNTLF